MPECVCVKFTMKYVSKKTSNYLWKSVDETKWKWNKPSWKMSFHCEMAIYFLNFHLKRSMHMNWCRYSLSFSLFPCMIDNRTHRQKIDVIKRIVLKLPLAKKDYIQVRHYLRIKNERKKSTTAIASTTKQAYHWQRKKTNFQFIFSCVLIAIHNPSEKTIHYHRMFNTRRQFAYFIFQKKQLQSFVFTFKIRWSGTHFIVLGTFQFRFRTMAISWVHRME